jgi:hypothetical protein
MPVKSVKYLVMIAGLSVVTVGAFLFTPPVREVETLGVVALLPDSVGEYRGSDLLFCQNEQCLKSFDVSDLDSLELCPSCHGVLKPASLGELNLLPPDTVLLKKRYSPPVFGAPFFVSVVISGANLKSLHRPQQCLPAQGNSIEVSTIVDIPRTGDDVLRVSELLVRRRAAVLNGRSGSSYFIYAYWFVSSVAETPSTLGRMAFSLRDRVLFSQNYRWAYISVSTEAPVAGLAAAKTRLHSFIRELDPMLRPEEVDPSQDAM